MNAKGYTITSPEAFSSLGAEDRKKTLKAINDVASFGQSMDKLISYAGKYGTKVLPWTEKKKIEAETRNAMLIAKELYNLWVLNWPDLSIMEQVIPDITSNSFLKWAFTNEKALMENAKKTVLDNITPIIANAGLSKVGNSQNISDPLEITTENDPLWLGF
jgi:hypothetical protein